LGQRAISASTFDLSSANKAVSSGFWSKLGRIVLKSARNLGVFCISMTDRIWIRKLLNLELSLPPKTQRKPPIVNSVRLSILNGLIAFQYSKIKKRRKNYPKFRLPKTSENTNWKNKIIDF
jgi:hypothetical protein